MREILVISGKGGTGKTSLAAAFAHLSPGAIICDLDVDAPDLHLILRPSHQETHDFYSGYEARIIPEKCENCGTCADMCRFDAVEAGEHHPVIHPLKCEGCKVCVAFCPADAVSFDVKHCGRWFVSESRFGPMVHAQLFPGEENSGRLVALLRQKAREMAEVGGQSLILSDGPPGIGCPVISSLSGVHLAVIVTEPTPSGLHDLERIVGLCDHFQIPAAIIINKCDLNDQMAETIASQCAEKGLRVVGRFAHDTDFVQAMIEEKAITEFSTGPIVDHIRSAWEAILSMANERAGSRARVQSP